MEQQFVRCWWSPHGRLAAVSGLRSPFQAASFSVWGSFSGAEDEQGVLGLAIAGDGKLLSVGCGRVLLFCVDMFTEVCSRV